MAEFCLKCRNKINKTADNKRKYVLPKDLELCECLGKLKHVIIMERKIYYICKFKYIVTPIRIIYNILY